MFKVVPLLLCAALVTGACAISLDVVDESARPPMADATDAGSVSPSPSPQPPTAPSPTPSIDGRATPLAPEPTPEPTPETATAVPEPTPTPQPPGRLTVTDTAAVGTLGDDKLSLVEAVQLANSRLTLGDLSAAEAALVRGAPGATNADAISVQLPDPATIILPGGDVWIVELFSNQGDTLIGDGVTLSGAAGGGSHNAMLIGSSDVTIRGFAFADVTKAIAVESAGNPLRGVTIDDNVFRNVQVESIHARNSLSEGSITGLRLVGNVFETTGRVTDSTAYITIRSGYGQTSEPVENTAITDVSISDNTMLSSGGAIRACITVAAAHVPFGSPNMVERATISDLTISDNTVTGCSTGVALAGGLVDQTNATVTASTITDTVITGNNIAGVEVAMQVHGALVAKAPPSFEFTGSTAATLLNNHVRGLRIDSNAVSNAAVGVRVVGAEFDVDGSGHAETNSVSEVTGDVGGWTGIDQPCLAVAELGALAARNAISPVCEELTG